MVMAASDAVWAVAVFAHNERAFIAATLESLPAAADGHRLDVFVLINGCTDRTEAIVEEYAERDPAVHPVVIALGDKANSWNVYVHEVAPKAEVHFFVDGDVRIRPASFRHLRQSLRTHPHAHAACGIPTSGRSQSDLARQILGGDGFHGSLYALRGRTLAALRTRRLRLPAGLVGDDSLLGWLLQRDFDPRRTGDRNRIVPEATAGFDFDSLSPWRLRDWRLYYRRLWRNSLRQMQLNLLMPILREQGLCALPADIADIYTAERLALLRARWPGIPGYFDSLAIRKMKSTLASRRHQY
jgi:glycosyltransferase involved in cell wall biosynthesis